MDISNPVLKLCYEGIQAESAGNTQFALALYTQAWDVRTDDYDACVAAHYIARHQQTPEDMLRWNLISLTHADAVNNETVASFYPSLYLNIAKSHELLGNQLEAHKYYQLASAKLADLSPGPYADIVHQGIENGLSRSR